MDMVEDDDKLIRSFFNENKKEIEDNGFSNRVIKSLPRRRSLTASVVAIALTIIALILFIVYDGFLGIIYLFRDLFINFAQNGSLNIDPSSIVIAVVVLSVLAIRKICTLS